MERAESRGSARRGLRLGRLAARAAHCGRHARGTGAVWPTRNFRSQDEILEDLAARVSPRVLEAPARLDTVRRELDEYFEGRRTTFDVPIDWSRFTPRLHLPRPKATARIPMERKLSRPCRPQAGSPRAVRAAGNALGANPMPVVVPCHRVLRSGGALGGYTGRDRAQGVPAAPRGPPALNGARADAAYNRPRPGEVAEWLEGTRLLSEMGGNLHRGFESLPLRPGSHRLAASVPRPEPKRVGLHPTSVPSSTVSPVPAGSANPAGLPAAGRHLGLHGVSHRHRARARTQHHQRADDADPRAARAADALREARGRRGLLLRGRGVLSRTVSGSSSCSRRCYFDFSNRLLDMTRSTTCRCDSVCGDRLARPEVRQPLRQLRGRARRRARGPRGTGRHPRASPAEEHRSATAADRRPTRSSPTPCLQRMPESFELPSHTRGVRVLRRDDGRRARPGTRPRADARGPARVRRLGGRRR